VTSPRAHGARFTIASAAGFLAGAIVLYAASLTIPFVADDWEFLLLVDTSRSIAVCFELLVGRFVRPLVMLSRYTLYEAFGLWPLPYHLFSVLLHALNAWLLCLLTMRLAGGASPRLPRSSPWLPRTSPWLPRSSSWLPRSSPWLPLSSPWLPPSGGSRWIGVAAGLLFLAFAGHTEAVTWVAGIADLFVAACLLGMLLAGDRAVEADRGGGWLALVWALSALGLLAKESAVVLPLVLAAFMLMRGAGWRRLVAHAGVPAAIVALFLVLRTRLYGPPTDAYGGLGTHAGPLFEHVRALLIRSFVPPSQRMAGLWETGADIPLLVALALAVAGAAAWRARARAALAFAVIGLGITLAPALPLSISVATTESERMIYVPSAFAAVITVVTIDALARRRTIAVAAIAALTLAHAVLLQRMHARWRAAADVFDGVTQSFVREARANDPGPDGLMFVLSLPDNVRGAYVFRRGFYAALHFRAPDLETRAASIVPVESQSMWRPDDVAVVRREGPMRVSLDVAPNTFLSAAPPVRPFYTFPAWTRSSYTLQFTPAVGNGAVFHVSGTRASFLGEVTGPGAPFGTVDIPEDGAPCRDTLRFSGWALDDRLVARVVVKRQPPSARADEVALAEATWAYGTRPDVAAAYAGFPHTGRTEWNFHFACSTLAALPEAAAEISVFAVDEEGHETRLGSRRVRLLR
jgi:hypothetical protein